LLVLSLEPYAISHNHLGLYSRPHTDAINELSLKQSGILRSISPAAWRRRRRQQQIGYRLAGHLALPPLGRCLCECVCDTHFCIEMGTFIRVRELHWNAQRPTNQPTSSVANCLRALDQNVQYPFEMRLCARRIAPRQIDRQPLCLFPCKLVQIKVRRFAGICHVFTLFSSWLNRARRTFYFCTLSAPRKLWVKRQGHLIHLIHQIFVNLLSHPVDK